MAGKCDESSDEQALIRDGSEFRGWSVSNGGPDQLGVGKNSSASCCAWSPPAAPRWRSIGWPIEASTRLNPRRQGGICRRAFLSRASVRIVRGRLRQSAFVASNLIVPAESAAAVLVASRCWCSCSATATPSGSRRWPISGWARRLVLAPIAAWIAIRGEVVMVIRAICCRFCVLGGAVLLWVAGFDIIYACQDVDFDRRSGCTACRPGSVCSGAATGGRLPPRHGGPARLLLPLVYPLFGWIYWAGIAAVAVLWFTNIRLVQPDDLTRVNTAFFNVNAVISIGLLSSVRSACWCVMLCRLSSATWRSSDSRGSNPAAMPIHRNPPSRTIRDKVEAGERLSFDDGLLL